jgi:hypothetical protein
MDTDVDFPLLAAREARQELRLLDAASPARCLCKAKIARWESLERFGTNSA